MLNRENKPGWVASAQVHHRDSRALALFSEQTLVQWCKLTTFPNVHVGHASTVAGVHLDDYIADVAAAGLSDSTMRYRNIKSDMSLTFPWLPVQATPTKLPSTRLATVAMQNFNRKFAQMTVITVHRQTRVGL